MKVTKSHFLAAAALIGLMAVLVSSYLHNTRVLQLSKPDLERIESLDDALKNGMISRAEYKYRVDQIRARAAQHPDASTPTSTTPDAATRDSAPHENPPPDATAPAPAQPTKSN